MTTPTTSDLEYVRTMTEAGRKAPLLGGRIYLHWGLLLPIAYVVQWAVLTGEFGLPPITLLYLWVATSVIGVGGMVLLVRSLEKKPGKGAINNQVEATVWTTAGFAIFAYAVGVLIATTVAGQPAWLWDLILSVAFGGYGIALITTGSVAGVSWMRIPATLSIIAAGVVPVLAGRPEVYLFAATTVLAVSAVPGVILMISEPKSLSDDE